MQEASERARDGDLEYFQSLEIESLKALCRARDEDGRSLLHSAVVARSLPLFELFLRTSEENQLEVLNGQDDNGWTPLHSAVSSGYEDLATKLLEAGAAVDPLTVQRRTPLMYAASKGRLDMVKRLLASEASLEVRDENGATVLHRAAGAGKLDVVDFLLETSLSQMETRDANGSTPLLAAAEGGYPTVVQRLVRAGADPDAADRDGELTAVAQRDPRIREAIRDGLCAREENRENAISDTLP